MPQTMISVRVHAAVAHGRITRNAIVRYPPEPQTDIPPIVKPFEGEIHSTIDLNGIAVIVPAAYRLPESLTPPDHISAPGAFGAYLTLLAARIPPVIEHDTAKVITIEF
ncbi:hypothetical protein [Duncaniella muris]|uniref:hypothetical protein n=1 Tax=Duncaniella muris TaxID=2094150 RepID=UPI00271474D5|nr:hypothetical protein [Duncaniella muris]